MEAIYSEEFFISANESNPEGELAVNVLVNSLIEIATLHANLSGFGNPHMQDLNAGWVLSRLTLEMSCYPKVNTSYKVLTWVEDWNRHFSSRCFEIQNKDGATIGYARSIWMVINTRTHENFGLEHLSCPPELISKHRCPIARQEKHAEILPAGSVIPEHSRALVANKPVRIYTFQYNDIDFYRHVNTLRYITLLLNAFSLEEFDHNFISRLEISFLHEGSFGESIRIERHDFESSEDGRVSAFSFIPENTEKSHPILFARLRLTPRD